MAVYTNFRFRPLDRWPGELTRDRTYSPFRGAYSDTREKLAREVGHLIHPDMERTHTIYRCEAVIEVAVPEGVIRQDGNMRADVAARNFEHPGVVVSFEGTDGPLQFACDRFITGGQLEVGAWKANLRAIALGLEALRKVQRYGMGRGHEQYRGFQALGSGVAMGPVQQMSKAEAVRILLDYGRLDGTIDMEYDDVADYPDVINSLYRNAAKGAHPDQGGDEQHFRMITEARDRLLPKELK